MRVTGEKEHLVVFGGLGDDLRHLAAAGRVEVNEHVVQDERERLGTICECLRETDPQAQVELLDAPALNRLLASISVPDGAATLMESRPPSSPTEGSSDV